MQSQKDRIWRPSFYNESLFDSPHKAFICHSIRLFDNYSKLNSRIHKHTDRMNSFLCRARLLYFSDNRSVYLLTIQLHRL